MDDTIVLTSDEAASAQSASDGITVSYSGIDMSSLNYSNISTSSITLPGSTVSGVIGGGCHINWNTTTPTYTTGTGTGIGVGTGTPYQWSPTNVGIQVPAESDIKIGDHSLKNLMQKMEERLAILVPDQKKLEKFEALKKAYEHYKTLESLCFIEEDDEQL